VKVNGTFDLTGLRERFGLSEKQLAYGVANAINRAAKDLQKKEQDNARAKLHLRGGPGEQLILRSVAKIYQFASATKGKAEAVIGIDTPKPRMVLSGLETGGIKQPFLGGRVAVPITGTPARPNMDASVPSTLLIRNLAMQPRLSAADRAFSRSIKGGSRKETMALRKTFARSKGGDAGWRGRERTFILPGKPVIFQRTGAHEITPIYKFIPQPKLKPMLGFRTLAIEQGDPMLARYLDDEVRKSVLHNAARGR
jgi:hypothetical protein